MRVLLVEDNPMNRRVLREMLRVADVALDEAELAEAGLQLVEQNDYDLVLMDLRMPGMDGLTAIAQIRARGDAKAKVPIIVVTADTALDLRAACLEAGADELIHKPVGMTALFSTIGEVVAARSGGAILA